MKSRFNPRTRTGCDAVAAIACSAYFLFQSTHPYRVRHSSARKLSDTVGFQSTHPYRVRHMRRTTRAGGWCFNPRTRTGCDESRARVQNAVDIVSIHAPVQGATGNSGVSNGVSFGFNPRTRTGCDSAVLVSTTSASTFQSTHPYRVRPRFTPVKCPLFCVSIHAPVQGATKS